MLKNKELEKLGKLKKQENTEKSKIMMQKKCIA
jgi:hypothetical protein